MGVRRFAEDIYRLQGERIYIYTGKEVSQDPYENNMVVTYNNPIPVIALVTDYTAAQAAYKMPGIITKKTKEIMIPKKYRTLLELSQKISIQGEDYEGWRENGKMQIRQIGNNDLRVYVYIKVV
jgi:hypothetical protein